MDKDWDKDKNRNGNENAVAGLSGEDPRGKTRLGIGSQEDRDEEGAGSGWENLLIQAFPPSMRMKITGLISAYLCVMGFVTYQSQPLLGETVTMARDGVRTAVSSLLPEVLVWETYITSRDVANYDWSGIASKFEEAEGVSRVRFGGSISAHYAAGEDPPVTDDDIKAFFGNTEQPYRLWGDKIGSDWGRELEHKDEIVVSQFTAQKYGKNLGDTIEFFGYTFTIVGISRFVPHAEGQPYGAIMIDYSYIDEAVACLKEIADKQEVLHPEWFMSDFHLEVFARGQRNKGIATTSIQPLIEELDSYR